MADKGNAATIPGANWLALRKTLPKSNSAKRTKHCEPPSQEGLSKTTSHDSKLSESGFVDARKGAPNDVNALKQMILGNFKQIPSKEIEIGRYIALDCGMVGVGPITTNENGDTETESSLACVSIVNFYGNTVMDVFVKQKERVTDYRTTVSGIRPKDLVSPDALAIEDVQQRVAHLLKDRILIGHAIHHLLKALMLVHSRFETVDTQSTPAVRSRARAQRVSTSGEPPESFTLRELVKMEFGIDLQAGKCISVANARAAMALFRLYKNSLTPMPRKRKRATSPTQPSQDPRENKLKKDVTSSYVADESKNEKRKKGNSSGPFTVGRDGGKATKAQKLSSIRGKATSLGDWWTKLRP